MLESVYLQSSRLPCLVFYIGPLTNKYQKYKSVELGYLQSGTGTSGWADPARFESFVAPRFNSSRAMSFICVFLFRNLALNKQYTNFWRPEALRSGWASQNFLGVKIEKNKPVKHMSGNKELEGASLSWDLVGK